MRTAVASRNRMLDAERAQYNNGYLRIYSGTRPTNADTALSGNTLLAELRWNATAFPAASGGVLTAAAITAAAAAASGTASFVRNFASDGTTALSDMSVGTSGAEVIVSTTTITATVNVSATLGATITLPVGT